MFYLCMILSLLGMAQCQLSGEASGESGGGKPWTKCCGVGQVVDVESGTLSCKEPSNAVANATLHVSLGLGLELTQNLLTSCPFHASGPSFETLLPPFENRNFSIASDGRLHNHVENYVLEDYEYCLDITNENTILLATCPPLGVA